MDDGGVGRQEGDGQAVGAVWPDDPKIREVDQAGVTCVLYEKSPPLHKALS